MTCSRFLLGHSRTIYASVPPTSIAFERNTRQLACFSGKLDKTGIPFFSRELFAPFLISFSSHSEGTPAWFALKHSQGIKCKARNFQICVFFCRLTVSISRTGFLALSTAREPICPIVLATSSALKLNTPNLACCTGKLDKKRFFFFFARIICSIFNLPLSFQWERTLASFPTKYRQGIKCKARHFKICVFF
ncbi:hypothetical protein ANAPRD1_01073 [Anaplasma phagocytophilum]|nr:hypothetical protein ANAPRD1_01073 [Anaplasma phagocytophilum]